VAFIKDDERAVFFTTFQPINDLSEAGILREISANNESKN
jgi:hypothetical protein